MGKEKAGFVQILINQLGFQSRRIDDEQYKVGTSPIKFIGRAEYLLRRRAMNKPFRFQAIQAVFTPCPCFLPMVNCTYAEPQYMLLSSIMSRLSREMMHTVLYKILFGSFIDAHIDSYQLLKSLLTKL